MEKITEALLAWYRANRRSLPWRDDPSPYHVWVSEIMLQQTRVEAVRGYYARFLEHFPDIRSLAEADEDECLKCWEGLGYYSRARNLQKGARQVMADYGGRMPRASADLQKIAGIGPYTAAAIASFCFGEKIAAIDGNLLRVFARLAGYGGDIKTPAARRAAEDFYRPLLPDLRPGDFNQALMDLGAMVCVPASPACRGDLRPGDCKPAMDGGGAGEGVPASPACRGDLCPLEAYCQAFGRGKCAEFPVMPAKKNRKIERRTILVIRDGEKVLIRRRPSGGLLAGLYEFPNEEGWLTEEAALARARQYGLDPIYIRVLPQARHVFTHKEWHMRGYELRVGGFEGPVSGQAAAGGEPAPVLAGDAFFASLSGLRDRYALPGAYAAYMPQS